MAVYFNPKVILYNAFLSKQKIDEYKYRSITFHDLRKFCNNLYDSIVQIGYKYVVIDCDTENIDDFCDTDNSFIKGIDKMFCTCKIDSTYVEGINRKYPKDIQVVLNASDTLWKSKI